VDTTRTQGSNRQLTYNLGTDRTPAWRPDGSSLLYTFEAIEADPRDRCLGELLPTGGTVTNIICPVTAGSVDSLDNLSEVAPGPDGRLLYVRESSPPDGITPSSSALVLASDRDPLNAIIVRAYPYTAANGKIHQGISNVRWRSETRAIFLAETVLYLAACGGCPTDTVRTGIEMVEVDLSGPQPTTSVVPNTEETSSLTIAADSDLVIFTRNGDGRVYQLTLSTGEISIVHDFGPALVARDVQVINNQLYAIVGGRVSFVLDPVLGSVQRDDGGALFTVDLSNGTSSPMPVTDRFFRRPAPSPSGNRLAVEAFPAVINACGPNCLDTTISRLADLWLFDIP
jgi:hypothetical protein